MPDNILELTSTIVSAFLGRNQTSATDLTRLIQGVHKALLEAVNPAPQPAPLLTPAVTARRSVTLDAILCMDCGKPFKSLRRHLSAEHGLSGEAYRAKWDLPKTYPMVTASYSAARSAMAKRIGLGGRGKGAAAEAHVADVASTAPAGSDGADAAPAKAKVRSGRTAKPSRDATKVKRLSAREG